jgi:agmatine deiminase
MPITTLLLAAASAALAQPLYPEGVAVPRHATDAELAWAAANPVATAKGAGTIPTGPVSSPGEYAPSEGIIMSWEGGVALNNIQRRMIKQITTVGNAKAFVVFDDATERNAVMPTFATNALSVGTDVTRVVPIVGATDTIWMRDYGPRLAYEKGVRYVSDHTYNVTSRTQDNNFPTIFAPFAKHGRYVLPLRHGGGNYHLNSIGEGFATSLITDENPTLSAAQIQNLWQQHWGVNTTIVPAFPQSVDATRHLDMWVQILGDRLVFVSDWPNHVGSTQDVICDNRAAAFAAAGWTVVRVPARSVNGTHYTYTNMVVCNDLALISSYTNGFIQQYNAQVLAAYQNALPGKTVVAINTDDLAVLAGVMHCIVMQIPAHRGAPGPAGGLAPTAYICAPQLAADSSLNPSDMRQVRWVSDDDEEVLSVTVALSLDDGATWQPVPNGVEAAADGSLVWTVPDRFSKFARLRVTAVDALGNTGGDVSGRFTINGTPCVADLGSPGGLAGADGLLDNNDFIVFIDRFFAQHFSADVGSQGGTTGGDGAWDNNDFCAFIDAFFTPC